MMATNPSQPANELQKHGNFEVIAEDLKYKRFLKVWNREVKFPNGKIVEWDVCGHSTARPSFCVVMPFFTRTKSTDMIMEYAQGVNRMVYTFAAGAIDAQKHDDPLECAKAELSEELRLKGGTWVPLLPTDSSGVPEVKWCTNTFSPFLCIDPQIDSDPLPRDFEGSSMLRNIRVYSYTAKHNA